MANNFANVSSQYPNAATHISSDSVSHLYRGLTHSESHQFPHRASYRNTLDNSHLYSWVTDTEALAPSDDFTPDIITHLSVR